MSHDRYRTVVQDERFERQRAVIEADVRRMDEALRYVETQLAREPTSGIETSVPGMWVAPVRVPAAGKLVLASVFYTFTDDYVYLRAIKLAV